MKNHAKRGVKCQNFPAPPFRDPPKEDFVWQGTSSPGVGVWRFNGAAWETGWHFCPRDSLNVIINQPTSLFFEAFSSRGAIESPPLCTEANTRGEKGCGDRPNTNSLSALGGTFTARMMCNCVGFHDGLTREHRTWVNNCQLAPCQLGRPHPGQVIS